ncbi:hypothetical protein D1007_17023 [Hordeum vulgare]|nr:hypothetical protein D1007_17023 [Hordeum vulgare]KAI4964992.1 hypothetical protein ZWY2020_057695 [Hordeum vulgare]KAI4988244.1 hypothetical protein ZWY2020_029874 [Hordeum vulgare]
MDHLLHHGHEMRRPVPSHEAALRSVQKPPAKPWRAGGGLTPAPAPTPPKVYRVEPREFRDLVQRLTGAPAMARQHQHQHGQQLLRAPTQPVPVRPGGIGVGIDDGVYASWCSFPIVGPPASMHPALDGHHLI